MFKKLIFLLAASVFLMACQGEPQVITEEVEVTRIVEVAQEVEVTRIVEVTKIVESIEEVEVTRIVEVEIPVTVTPTPSPTPAPTVEAVDPVFVEGSGDDVISPDFNAFGFVDVTNSGGFFAITSYDADGERIDLMVNTTNPYSGRLPVNLYDTAASFEIQSSGNWSMSFYPLPQIDQYEAGDTIEGEGDFVFFLDDGAATLNITGNDGGNFFAVISHGATRDLLVNTTDPYESTVRVDGNRMLIEIQAKGAWTVETMQ